MARKEKAYTLLAIALSEEEAEEVALSLRGENVTLLRGTLADFPHALAGKSPDLILLPADAAHLHGIRAHPATHQVPVIFLCPARGEDVPARLPDDPFSDFILLPARSNELPLRIYRLLSRSKAGRSAERERERLRREIATRDRLYSVIAHDLRAPIGTIKMINAIIESEKNKIRDAGIREKFEMINRTTEEAFNLLENLLRWTRSRTSSTPAAPAMFNIASSLRQIVSLFTAIAHTKPIRLLAHLPEEVTVWADEDMIKTVLRNLISNAVKFTHPGGKVEIRLTVEEGFARVSVKDNGVGIPPERRRKIMAGKEPFTTYGTKNEKGFGIGLKLCKEFIRINKGVFRLDSAPGKGSTFSFTVPLSPERSVPA